jgi:hypothetical protein
VLELLVLSASMVLQAETLVVKANRSPAWGAAVRLIDDGAIGKLDDPSAHTLGVIEHVAIRGDGDLFVYDAADTVVRQFNGRGHLVRTIGRSGHGPGEFERVRGIGLTRARTLVVWDIGNARITLFDSLGKYRTSHQVLGGVDEANAFALDPDGISYVKAMSGPRSASGRVGATRCSSGQWSRSFVRISEKGVTSDAIPLNCADPPFEPLVLPLPEGPRSPFTEDVTRFVRSDGAVVEANNTRYALHLRDARGKAMRVEHGVAPTPVTAAERTQWQEWARYLEAEELKRGIRHQFNQIPRNKPFFRAIFADNDSRMWVDRYVSALRQPVSTRAGQPPIVWREPVTYDLLAADGHLLATIQPPAMTRLLAAQGDTVWGVRQGEQGEEYLVRFRIERPARVPNER